MKVSGEVLSQKFEDIDVDLLIASDRMNVRLKKNFTKKESNYIMAITRKCSTGKKTVNWKRVAEFFESGCDQREIMKKIKNHYYNKRSAPTRVNTKRNDFRMSFLGLDI